MALLTERYADKIQGTISCFDRVVIGGTWPEICHARVLATLLKKQGVRLFDYPRWAEPYRELIRENAERLARENGLKIDFISQRDFRMADRIKEVVAERGDHPGLVHIFSVMEGCVSFRPWHDKTTGATHLKPRRGQCLHYYFYFIDEELGLCHIRVPTWAPFPVQFYFNGHNWLANRLLAKGIGFTLADNAFLNIDNFDEAQKLADSFPVKDLHRRLDMYTRFCCPIHNSFPAGVHWTIRQIEYAMDIVWNKPDDLTPVYDELLRRSVLAVKAVDIAAFLGRRWLGPDNDSEIGSDLKTRIEGTRIKHHMGPSSIKMYNKFGRVLRLETTCNDVSFFKHRRKVEHRDGTSSMKLAPMRKTIYSLGIVAELFGAANRRYLKFLSALDDQTTGFAHVESISRPVRKAGRNHRGFNLFCGDDLDLIIALIRGEHTITGLRNGDLRRHLGKKSSQVSRMLKRLRLHGLIRKIGHTYKYYITELGRRVVAAALSLREEVVIPVLNGA
jgi:hypothetical protein